MYIVIAALVVVGLLAMVFTIASANRRSRDTVSEERAEREGRRGADGLAEAKRRHDTDSS